MGANRLEIKFSAFVFSYLFLQYILKCPQFTVIERYSTAMMIIFPIFTIIIFPMSAIAGLMVCCEVKSFIGSEINHNQMKFLNGSLFYLFSYNK